MLLVNFLLPAKLYGLWLRNRGNKFLRKALSYTEQTWDFDKCQEKDSCTTMEDVIQYVRPLVYNYMNTHKNTISEGEDVDEEERKDDYTTAVKKGDEAASSSERERGSSTR